MFLKIHQFWSATSKANGLDFWCKPCETFDQIEQELAGGMKVGIQLQDLKLVLEEKFCK